jgi:hypothetical protein
MVNPYYETRKDMDQMKKILRRLHQRKEQEISLHRMGKRMPASRVREMREMEGTIESILERDRLRISTQQKNLFENFKNTYRSQMRAWKNRLMFAERTQFKRSGGATRKIFREA